MVERMNYQSRTGILTHVYHHSVIQPTHTPPHTLELHIRRLYVGTLFVWDSSSASYTAWTVSTARSECALEIGGGARPRHASTHCTTHGVYCRQIQRSVRRVARTRGGGRQGFSDPRSPGRTKRSPAAIAPLGASAEFTHAGLCPRVDFELLNVWEV